MFNTLSNELTDLNTEESIDYTTPNPSPAEFEQRQNEVANRLNSNDVSYVAVSPHGKYLGPVTPECQEYSEGADYRELARKVNSNGIVNLYADGEPEQPDMCVGEGDDIPDQNLNPNLVDDIDDTTIEEITTNESDSTTVSLDGGKTRQVELSITTENFAPNQDVEYTFTVESDSDSEEDSGTFRVEE